MRFDLFLKGYAFYRVEGERVSLLFQLLKAEGFSPKYLKRAVREGTVRFCLSGRESVRFEQKAGEGALPFVCEKKGGVPLILQHFLHSPGLIVGVLLSLVLFLGLRLVAWDVRVEGNANLSLEELEGELAACGIYRGCFLPTLDVDAAALSLRGADGRVAYAAVNRVGTVIYVQIREAQSAPPADSKKPANLVAKCDGVVVMPLIFEGICLVGEGDVVRKGQILAGGVIDTQNHGYRVTRAAGQVLARTVRTYTVKAPLVFEEKRYIGKPKKEISIILFDWHQKVFKNTGNYIDKCDIIEKTEWITLPSGEKLPFGYHVKGVAEYCLVSVVRTCEQARAAAERELSLLLSKECEGRTVLQTSVTAQEDAEGVTLTCTVVYEEDIAEVAEFTLRP